MKYKRIVYSGQNNLGLHAGCPQSNGSVLGGCGHQGAWGREMNPGDGVLVAYKAESPRLCSQIPDHQDFIRWPGGCRETEEGWSAVLNLRWGKLLKWSVFSWEICTIHVAKEQTTVANVFFSMEVKYQKFIKSICCILSLSVRMSPLWQV